MFSVLSCRQVVADPDLELRWGGGGDGLDLLALLTFLPSLVSCFFTQNKGGGPLDPALAGILVQQKTSDNRLMIRDQFRIFSVGLDLACNGSSHVEDCH